MTQLTSIARFERFFRAAAGLNVDKSDLKRYTDFVNQKTYDLLLIGQAHAKANARSLIEPFDLPITKGLQECIHRFREMDETIELQPILDHITRLPPLDLEYSDDTRNELAQIVGGLSVALAQSFLVIDPRVKHPNAGHWERAFQLFILLL